MNWRTWAAFGVVGILWGSAWVVTPLLPEQQLAAGALRFAIAAAVLGLVGGIPFLRRSRRPYSFPLVPSVVLGLIMVGVPYALAVWAKGTVSAGLFPVLYSTMPLVAFLFGRKTSIAPIPAASLGVGGIAFVVAQGISYSSSQLGGLCLLIGAVLLGAFALNYAKGNIPEGSFVLSSALQCAVASILLGCVSAVTGELRLSSWSGQSFMAVTALAVTESVIALPLLYWLLARVEPWQAAELQWLATLCAVSEAAWFLRAKPTLQMAGGAVLTMGAMVWLMRVGGSVTGSGSGAGAESDVVTLQITSMLQSPPDASDSR